MHYDAWTLKEIDFQSPDDSHEFIRIGDDADSDTGDPDSGEDVPRPLMIQVPEPPLRVMREGGRGQHGVYAKSGAELLMRKHHARLSDEPYVMRSLACKRRFCEALRLFQLLKG